MGMRNFSSKTESSS